MRKKGAHQFLRRLLKLVNYRQSFANRVTQLRQQLHWLIELAHWLDRSHYDNPDAVTSQQVRQTIDCYLQDLLAQQAKPEHDDFDCQVANHINQTLRSAWWGLFTCYDVADLPQTNNELETFIRRIKTSQRRVSGRRNVHDFILRYGAYVTYVDYQEREVELLARLQEINQTSFLEQRRKLDANLLRERKRFRFRRRREVYLRDLEQRWAQAIENDAKQAIL